MNKGILFNIQKFSLHDGPGIRTTIFLKGCPLRCAWCSNPESQLDKVQILYDQTKCVHCQSCIKACTQHAITIKNYKIHIDFDACKGCLQCVHQCPNNALSHEGEYRDFDEIVSICLQDEVFYEESNGGITISGGEGMSQPDFLKALITKLKEHHLHIAIETTGYVPAHIFKEIAPMLDLLLFDVKHYDKEKHIQGTQVSNEIIIENLTWAIQHNIEVLPRIPVIPGFNDSISDAEGISNLLIQVGAKQAQLLPFHQFGEKKYALLNKEYAYKDKKALYPEDLKDYQQVFLDKGIHCFF